MDSSQTSWTMLRAVLRHAPVGVLVVERGSGRIRFANFEIERMLGYEAGALDGALLPQLLPPSVVGTHDAWVENYFKQGQPRRMGAGQKLWALHRSGRTIPIEVGLMLQPVDGETLALAYVSDRSEATRLQALSEGVSTALPLGLLIVDVAGRIVQANASLERMFGYGPGELEGSNLEVLLPERFRAGHPEQMGRFFERPSPRAMGSGRDLMARHRSGLEFPVEVALNSYESANGRLVIAVVSDISSRKAAEDALRQTNEQLEEFTYVASHDLRSPLRGIAELLSWIREDLPEAVITPDIAHNFDRARVRIERGERMIDDLLDYARAGQREKRCQTVDPHELVLEAVASAEVPASFQVQLAVSASPFETAAAPLAVVLRNLVGNAVKHNPNGQGRISVSAFDQGRFAVFVVEDDGPGVPAAARDRIFKLFHRANAKSVGHGVGLAVSRRMVNVHGGAIVVDRSELLGGARFTVQWPRIGLREAEDE